MATLGFEVHKSLEIFGENGERLYLTHHPQWEKLKNGEHAQYDYMFNGHVHERWARVGKLINVGVDRRNYAPATLAELIATPDEETNPLPPETYQP